MEKSVCRFEYFYIKYLCKKLDAARGFFVDLEHSVHNRNVPVQYQEDYSKGTHVSERSESKFPAASIAFSTLTTVYQKGAYAFDPTAGKDIITRFHSFCNTQGAQGFISSAAA